MNRLTAFPLIAMMAIVSSCGNTKDKDVKTPASSNPLLKESTLPYQAIPFDKIKDADYQPAIEAGIKQRLEEIEKIANNPEAATFENTFVDLEKSGQLLERANNAFDVVTGANTNPTLQKVQEEEAPKLKASKDAIYLNPKLFARVEEI
jgi:peptidyl-dipeptidase Dcp